jgi:uncharacterized cupredoxin-like copper-binding protein
MEIGDIVRVVRGLGGRKRIMIKNATAAAASLQFAVIFGLANVGHAHMEHHSSFLAGEIGDPNKSARTVKVSMQEDGRKMTFDPAVITVRKGEQIRFVLFNEGSESHEFVLGTSAENSEHAELMKQFPHMTHDDPNAKRVDLFHEGQLLWKFTKTGEFEYACLIPGHYEAGMHGKIVVK